MTLRSPRERLLQTLCYEAGGLALITPLYMLATGHGAEDGLLVLAALSVAVTVWSPLHNTAFDWLDLRLSGRVASDRPHAWRIVHALSHEATAFAVTVPLLVWLGGHGWWEAAVLDLLLTGLYTAWAYAFHLAYDRIRPVRPFATGVRA